MYRTANLVNNVVITLYGVRCLLDLPWWSPCKKKSKSSIKSFLTTLSPPSESLFSLIFEYIYLSISWTYLNYHITHSVLYLCFTLLSSFQDVRSSKTINLFQSSLYPIYSIPFDTWRYLLQTCLVVTEFNLN